jgi:ABC-type uncharacterized transport system permease subunit
MGEFLVAFLRWTVPLLAVFLAVACFYRVGVINIAADGTIKLSAVIYAALGLVAGPYAAALATVAIGLAVGFGVVWVIVRFRVDAVLFTLSANILFGGLASLICYLAFHQPGNGPLGDRRIPLWAVEVALSVAIASVVAAIAHFRTLQLGAVIGLSEQLALAEGLDTRIIRLYHGSLGGVLLGLSGIALAEMGGSYTSGVSAQRGFVGLLVVAACWPYSLRVLLWAPVVGLVQVLILRYEPDLRRILRFDIASSFESIILLLALAVLLLRSIWRGKRWPDGKGSEDVVLSVRKEGEDGP